MTLNTINSNKIYVYPKLDSFIDIGIRIGGFGLANCLFVYARSIVIAEKRQYKLINPTWERIGIGQYLRNEKDKRHYFGIFKKDGIYGLKKYFLIWFSKYHGENCNEFNETHRPNIIKVQGLDKYFEPLLPYQHLIKQKLFSISKVSIRREEFSHTIGVHIRLGDFINKNRTPIDWYIDKIHQINQIAKNEVKFTVFSDGTNDELKTILDLKNVKRSSSNNALADIFALSECLLILGSDSTFSGWGAFLGQKPAIFFNKHFGSVLINKQDEIILKLNEPIPEYINKYLAAHLNLL